MLRLVPPASLRVTSRPRRGLRRDRIAAAIARCSARDRELLALLVLERLTFAEAAAALGIPVERARRRHAMLFSRLGHALAGVTRVTRVTHRRARVRRAS